MNCLGCLYVCMYGCLGTSAWACGSKTLSFYDGRSSPCTPPHERAQNVPKRSPGVRFHGGFGGEVLQGSEAYISIYTWISFVYREILKNNIFNIFFKFSMFCPFFHFLKIIVSEVLVTKFRILKQISIRYMFFINFH